MKMQHEKRKTDPNQPELKDWLISLNRTAKVVKGGRRFGFSALVVVGDSNGRVGFGLGKAKEVPESIAKGIEAAKKGITTLPLSGVTLPNEVKGRYGASRVILKPAAPGTGVVAGGATRKVLDLAGVRDVIGKSLGSSNPHNVVRATFDAFRVLREAEVSRGLRAKLMAENAAAAKAATA